MLQVTEIKANKSHMVEALKKRGLQNPDQSLQEILDLYETKNKKQNQLDTTLSELNSISKTIGGLLKQGRKEEAERAKARTSELKASKDLLSKESFDLETQLKDKLYQVPNIPNDLVKNGKSDADNEVVFQVKEIPEPNDYFKPQWELVKEYDIVDFDLGVKVSGAGFPIYKGKGAKIQRALINFFLSEGEKAGYTEIQPPLLINEDSGFGTGQLPDKEGQMYHASEDDLYLIPTAEVPITNMYRDVILNEESLPVKLTGYSPCFRREAGSWGAHVRGLNRLHQFDKVEIVQIQHPDRSYEALEQMVDYVESLVKALGLPYRILRLCGGDLGFTSALTYDFEVYSVAQKMWLEVSSVSNFETFQANRLKLRFKDKNKKKQLCHTLNGSALALPRILAAILENYQEQDGIKVPDVLIPFTGFDKITK